MTQPASYEPTYTVAEFCLAEHISRSELYEQWRQGIGPRFYYTGNRRRITHQARLGYQRDREAAAVAA